MTRLPSHERHMRRRLEQLGSNDPRCSTCGEADWRTLELHHIASRSEDDMCAVVCRNCHRKLSDDQHGHPAKLPDTDAGIQSIAHFLLGLADMLALIVPKLREFGAKLAERANEGGTVS